MAKKFKENQKVYVATRDGIAEGKYMRVAPGDKMLVVKMDSYGYNWEFPADVFGTRVAAERRAVWLSVQFAKQLRGTCAKVFQTQCAPILRRAAKYDPEGATPDWLVALEGDANLTGHPHLSAAIEFCKKHLGVK